jgi:1-acyl-sn-glycerol-3-phosphate acyltransferase
MVDTVFVRREDKSSRNASRNKVAAALARSLRVVVFPEGTTSAGPGILPFRPGIFEVAAGYGFAVVPAAIEYENKDDAWVGEDTFFGHFMRCFARPRIKVRVVFGPVIRGESGAEIKELVEHWVKGRLGGESDEESNVAMKRRIGSEEHCTLSNRILVSSRPKFFGHQI